MVQLAGNCFAGGKGLCGQSQVGVLPRPRSFILLATSQVKFWLLSEIMIIFQIHYCSANSTNAECSENYWCLEAGWSDSYDASSSGGIFLWVMLLFSSQFFIPFWWESKCVISCRWSSILTSTFPSISSGLAALARLNLQPQGTPWWVAFCTLCSYRLPAAVF